MIPVANDENYAVQRNDGDYLYEDSVLGPMWVSRKILATRYTYEEVCFVRNRLELQLKISLSVVDLYGQV